MELSQKSYDQQSISERSQLRNKHIKDTVTDLLQKTHTRRTITEKNTITELAERPQSRSYHRRQHSRNYRRKAILMELSQKGHCHGTITERPHLQNYRR